MNSGGHGYETGQLVVADAMRLRRQLGGAGPLVRTHPEAYSIELRCRAIEQRIDLDLQLGPSAEIADIVGELRALVAEYPLRERF